jgi:hypothetical protein
MQFWKFQNWDSKNCNQTKIPPPPPPPPTPQKTILRKNGLEPRINQQLTTNFNQGYLNPSWNQNLNLFFFKTGPELDLQFFLWNQNQNQNQNWIHPFF